MRRYAQHDTVIATSRANIFFQYCRGKDSWFMSDKQAIVIPTDQPGNPEMISSSTMPPPAKLPRLDQQQQPQANENEDDEADDDVVFLRRVLQGKTLAEASDGLSDVRTGDLLSALHWTGLELYERFKLESVIAACELSEAQVRTGIDDTISTNVEHLFVDRIDSVIPSVILTLSCPNALQVDVRSHSLTVSSVGIPIQVKKRPDKELL